MPKKETTIYKTKRLNMGKDQNGGLKIGLLLVTSFVKASGAAVRQPLFFSVSL